MIKRFNSAALVLLRKDILRLMGAVVGGYISYWMTNSLANHISVFACSVIVTLAALGSIQHSQPLLWWALLGAIAGSILGTSSVLAASAQQMELPGEVRNRAIAVASLGLAGLISGTRNYSCRIPLGPRLPRLSPWTRSIQGKSLIEFAVDDTLIRLMIRRTH